MGRQMFWETKPEQKQEAVTTERSPVHSGRPSVAPPSAAPPGQVYKGAFLCRETLQEPLAPIFETICPISHRTMETLLVLCLALTFASTGKNDSLPSLEDAENGTTQIHRQRRSSR